MPIHSKAAAGGAALLASAALAVGFIPGSAQATGDMPARQGTETRAHLDPLNNSGAKGHAMVRTNHRKLHVDVHAHGLVKGMPHAQHIHFGAQARHECPTAPDDANGDHQLTTTDGAPAYGPVRISLTTEGDTSAASVLAVDRYPTAPRGRFTYNRQTRTSKGVAAAIRRGEAVYVVHRVDYNGNGVYDFGAGKSDLDKSLPAEATDPAACSVLKVQN